MITRQAIVDEAREWVGTRWKHQALKKGLACDCIGLIGGIALELGVTGAQQWRDTPAFHNYGRQPDPELLIEGCNLLLDPIKVDDATIGDVLLFRFASEPQHFGIISAPGYVIHAYAQARKVAENRIDHVWRSRIVGAYQFRGIG